MKKLMMVLMILAMASMVQAATLKWDVVPDTSDCIVLGYKVVAVAQNQEGGDPRVKLTTTNALPELFLSLRLVPNQAYDLSVLAYAAAGDGELSESIPYTYIPGNLQETLPEAILYLPAVPTTPVVEQDAAGRL